MAIRQVLRAGVKHEWKQYFDRFTNLRPVEREDELRRATMASALCLKLCQIRRLPYVAPPSDAIVDWCYDQSEYVDVESGRFVFNESWSPTMIKSGRSIKIGFREIIVKTAFNALRDPCRPCNERFLYNQWIQQSFDLIRNDEGLMGRIENEPIPTADVVVDIRRSIEKTKKCCGRYSKPFYSCLACDLRRARVAIVLHERVRTMVFETAVFPAVFYWLKTGVSALKIGRCPECDNVIDEYERNETTFVYPFDDKWASSFDDWCKMGNEINGRWGVSAWRVFFSAFQSFLSGKGEDSFEPFSIMLEMSEIMHGPMNVKEKSAIDEMSAEMNQLFAGSTKLQKIAGASWDSNETTTTSGGEGGAQEEPIIPH